MKEKEEDALGSLSFIWTPRFEPNRLPTGRVLSYYNGSTIVGGEGFYFDPPTPSPKFENGEFAFRLNRRLGSYTTALYFYKGFYKNPMGVTAVDTLMIPTYPELNIYGTSVRGPFAGGIVWLEGGYYDSRQDADGDNPMMPNSSITGMIGFERQVASNLTANIQWQADLMYDWGTYQEQQSSMGMYIRDEVKHLVTSRVTKLLYDELLSLSMFVFYSPTDEDGYLRTSAVYKHTDELSIAVGANIFDGNHEATEFGQFAKNDNVYMKLTYGF